MFIVILVSSTINSGVICCITYLLSQLFNTLIKSFQLFLNRIMIYIYDFPLVKHPCARINSVVTYVIIAANVHLYSFSISFDFGRLKSCRIPFCRHVVPSVFPQRVRLARYKVTQLVTNRNMQRYEISRTQHLYCDIPCISINIGLIKL